MFEQQFWDLLEELVKSSSLVVDRPKGSAHPRFPHLIYPQDYGYLSGTSSMDGEGIDIWLGSEKEKQLDALICVVDKIKRDSEIKLLLGCTEAEKQEILRFHNNSQWMKGILIRR